MVLVQNWPFFHVFILGNMGQENVFYDILKGKNDCLGYKNETFKRLKREILPNGLDICFCPKLAIFPSFYFT